MLKEGRFGKHLLAVFRTVVTLYFWTPLCCDWLSGCAVWSRSHILTPALFLSGVEDNGTDGVSEVRPTQHQASGLPAALMSSPEWLAGWWRRPAPSLLPLAQQAPDLIGLKRERETSELQETMLWSREKERGRRKKKSTSSSSSQCKPLHPNYNFQHNLEDYISQYVLRPRRRTCVKREVSGVLFGGESDVPNFCCFIT